VVISCSLNALASVRRLIAASVKWSMDRVGFRYSSKLTTASYSVRSVKRRFKNRLGGELRLKSPDVPPAMSSANNRSQVDASSWMCVK